MIVFLLVKLVVLFGQFGDDFKRVDAGPIYEVPRLGGQVLTGRVTGHDHHVSLEIGHKTLDEAHDACVARGLATAQVSVSSRKKHTS